MKLKADNWRGLITAIVWIEVIIGGILAVVAGNQADPIGFNFGVFLAVVFSFVVVVLLTFIPHFMIAQTMEGVASVLEEVASIKAASTPARSSRSRPGSLETSAVEPDYQGEPSAQVRRVAGAVGAIGSATGQGATRHAVADKLGLTLEEVTEALRELRARGLVERLDSGRFRYVDADTNRDSTATVFCEDCGHTVSESIVETGHQGHSIRR